MTQFEELTSTIVFGLASEWSELRTKEGLNRLLRKYNMTSDTAVPFECMYIAEAEYAASSIIRAWWKVDDNGLVATRGPQRWFDELSSTYYRCPVLKFSTDGKSVAIGERLGPRLLTSTVASVAIRDGKYLLEDFRVVFVSTPE